MPQLSTKGISMPASPIRKLVPYAEAAKKRGIKVYHLNIGQPDIATPDAALNAIKNYDERVIEYGHSAGNEQYRKGLAEYYQGIGIDVSFENIIVTTGGSEALVTGMMACLNPGDEIIIPEPFYTNYNSFAIQAGAVIKPIATSIDTGFALPAIEKFEELIGPRTKAVLVCNPNNPTGYLYSREELEQLRRIALKHDLYLFSDEVYREFCYDGLEHFSCLQLEGLENNVVLIDSTSKRYSMCGIRIGALITRNSEVAAAALRFGQARLCPPALGQVAAQAALQTPPEYFSQVYNEYIERRNFMVDALNRIPGLRCPMPRGAFYTIVELPVDDADDFARWMLEEFDYQGRTVMIAPAAGFYSTAGSGKNQARIAYVLKKEDLENAVVCLQKGLERYRGR